MSATKAFSVHRIFALYKYKVGYLSDSTRTEGCVGRFNLLYNMCSVTPKPKGPIGYYPALLAKSREDYVR